MSSVCACVYQLMHCMDFFNGPFLNVFNCWLAGSTAMLVLLVNLVLLSVLFSFFFFFIGKSCCCVKATEEFFQNTGLVAIFLILVSVLYLTTLCSSVFPFHGSPQWIIHFLQLLHLLIMLWCQILIFYC